MLLLLRLASLTSALMLTLTLTLGGVAGGLDESHNNNDGVGPEGTIAIAASAASTAASSWKFPLLLSCLAGASTCVGASVVFCFKPSTIRRSMAFSLSLAAAVMITISVVSILPEVAKGIVVVSVADYSAGIDSTDMDANANADADAIHNRNYHAHGTRYSHVRTDLLLERLFSFAVGVGAYLLLAKLMVFLPDPEHLYLLDNPGEDEDYKRNYDLYLSDVDDDNDDSNDNVVAAALSVAAGDSNDDDCEYDYEKNSKDNVRRRTTGKKMDSSSNNSRNRNSNRRDRDRALDRALSLSTDTILSSSSNSNSNGLLLPQQIVHAVDENSNNNRTNNLFHLEQGGEDLRAFSKEQRKRSWRVALMLFVSLLIHNFPEGLCVAASAKESPELGITVAIGIFIHNVPEGIAISVPCIAARPDRPWLAFWLASASGLAEPLGAAVALLLLGDDDIDSGASRQPDLENVLGFVAGVMITVALWELYPEAIQASRYDGSNSSSSSSSSSRETTTTTNTITITSTRQRNNASFSTFCTCAWIGQQLRRPTRFLLQKQNRSIVWGSIVGMALMVATELYLT